MWNQIAEPRTQSRVAGFACWLEKPSQQWFETHEDLGHWFRTFATAGTYPGAMQLVESMKEFVKYRLVKEERAATMD